MKKLIASMLGLLLTAGVSSAGQVHGLVDSSTGKEIPILFYDGVKTQMVTQAAWLYSPSSGVTNTYVTVGASNLFAGVGSTGLITAAIADAGKFLRADGTWQSVGGSIDSNYFQNAIHLTNRQAVSVSDWGAGSINLGGGTVSNGSGNFTTLSVSSLYAQVAYLTNLYVTNIWTTYTNLWVQGDVQVDGTITSSWYRGSGYYLFDLNGTNIINATIDDAKIKSAAHWNSALQTGDSSVALAYIPNNTLYVDGKRTDVYVADGSIVKPFTTIQAAIDAVISPSTTNKYLINIAPGPYYTAPITVNKDQVTFRGSGVNGARISGLITVNTLYTNQITFDSLRISGGLQCYSSHIAINVIDCNVSGGTWTFTPTVATDDEYLQIWSGIWYANVVLTNVYTYIMGGGYYSTWQAYGKEFNINNADINTPFNVTLDGSIVASAYGNRAGSSGFTVNNGATLYMDADTEGGSSLTINSGGTLVRTTKAGNITNNSVVAGATVKDALNNLESNKVGYAMSASIIPTVSNAYDIGSDAFPIRDLKMGTNSLYMGGQRVLSYNPATTQLVSVVPIVQQTSTTNTNTIAYMAVTGTPTNGQVLAWNAGSSQWNPTNQSGGGGGSISFVAPPAATNSTGTPGQLAYNSSYFYVCVTNNSWKRAILAGW